MQKTLTRHGNSLALVIYKPILELLGISGDTPLEISMNGDALIIQPVRGPDRQAKLDATLDLLNQQVAPALEKLAE
jgi:antitoxin component of MazEF toxin-antitoxin module